MSCVQAASYNPYFFQGKPLVGTVIMTGAKEEVR